MSIKINVIERKNPRDLAAPVKFYASTQNQGSIGLEGLSKQIAMISTVSKADIYAVLISLTEIIPQSLEDGKIVKLGSLGSFRVALNSEASDTAEEVTIRNVKQLKLRYRPTNEIKKIVEDFPLEKA